MQTTPDRSYGAATLAVVATTGALAGWWWQSSRREATVEEHTRARLRRWSLR